MHTIQLHTIPFRKVWKKEPATLLVAIAAAAFGTVFSPAIMISLASNREPIRLPVYDRLQFLRRPLFQFVRMCLCVSYCCLVDVCESYGVYITVLE